MTTKATAKPSSSAASASATRSANHRDHRHSRISVPKRPNPSHSYSNDPLSDRATENLIRRVLCPQQPGDKGRAQLPIEQLLPPLTSRNDIDLQLYAILAIVIREFLQSWYSKITPDETFTAQVLQIVAHCTRALEQRCRMLDLESLLLDEIPDLLEKHILARRACADSVTQHPIRVNEKEAYHALCPLPFLAPVPGSSNSQASLEQVENERLYRQLLVQAVFAVLLPTEDLENPCLTALVEQIFSELIIGNIVAEKAAQPWWLYEVIGSAAKVLHEKKTVATQRIVSGNYSTDAFPSEAARNRGWSVRSFFILLIQLVIMSMSAIRILVTTVVRSSSLPPRTLSAHDRDKSEASSNQNEEDPSSSNVPFLEFKLWSCIGELVQLSSRMPWTCGCLSLLQYWAVYGPGRIAGLNQPIDRLLSNNVRRLLWPSQLPPLLRTLREVMFPRNTLGKSSLSPPSSERELLKLRRRAAKSLLDLLPRSAGRLYFGARLWRRGSATDDEIEAEERAMLDQVEELLSVVSDEYCNKHLMYSLLELVLVRLLPELNEKGVQDLWDERLS